MEEEYKIPPNPRYGAEVCILLTTLGAHRSELAAGKRACDFLDIKRVHYKIFDFNTDMKVQHDPETNEAMDKAIDLLYERDQIHYNSDDEETQPQIFVDGNYIGDDSSLQELEDNGLLGRICRREVCPKCHSVRVPGEGKGPCGTIYSELLPGRLTTAEALEKCQNPRKDVTGQDSDSDERFAKYSLALASPSPASIKKARTVSVSLAITGIDNALITSQANAGVQEAVAEAVKSAIAEEVGRGVTAGHISISRLDGSDSVLASISTPGLVTTAALGSALRKNDSDSLKNAVVRNINQVRNLKRVTAEGKQVAVNEVSVLTPASKFKKVSKKKVKTGLATVASPQKAAPAAVSPATLPAAGVYLPTSSVKIEGSPGLATAASPPKVMQVAASPATLPTTSISQPSSPPVYKAQQGPEISLPTSSVKIQGGPSPAAAASPQKAAQEEKSPATVTTAGVIQHSSPPGDKAPQSPKMSLPTSSVKAQGSPSPATAASPQKAAQVEKSPVTLPTTGVSQNSSASGDKAPQSGASATQSVPLQARWLTSATKQMPQGFDPRNVIGKVRIFDPALVNSVSKAVSGLNKGSLDCPEGFCLMWSSSKQGYFVVWSHGHKAAAFAAVGLDLSGQIEYDKSSPKSASSPKKESSRMSESSLKSESSPKKVVPSITSVYFEGWLRKKSSHAWRFRSFDWRYVVLRHLHIVWYVSEEEAQADRNSRISESGEKGYINLKPGEVEICSDTGNDTTFSIKAKDGDWKRGALAKNRPGRIYVFDTTDCESDRPKWTEALSKYNDLATSMRRDGKLRNDVTCFMGCGLMCS